MSNPRGRAISCLSCRKLCQSIQAFVGHYKYKHGETLKLGGHTQPPEKFAREYKEIIAGYKRRGTMDTPLYINRVLGPTAGTSEGMLYAGD